MMATSDASGSLGQGSDAANPHLPAAAKAKSHNRLKNRLQHKEWHDYIVGVQLVGSSAIHRAMELTFDAAQHTKRFGRGLP